MFSNVPAHSATIPTNSMRSGTMRFKRISLLALMLAAALALADEHKSDLAPNAQFDKMKSLNGSWVGEMVEAGKPNPATTRFQLISDGSALMAWLGEGSPYEMVTI